MRRILLISFIAVVYLVGGPLPSLTTPDLLAQDMSELEERVERLEEEVRDLDRYTGLGGVAFLFGAFCALWAQNTRRNVWLWFFLGAFFTILSVIVLLVKNAQDRRSLPDEEDTAEPTP